MAAKYSETITTQSGTVIEAVKVQALDSNGVAQVLYTDVGLTTPSTPESTAVYSDTEGLAEFYIADGTYTIVYTWRSTTKMFANVELYDLSSLKQLSADLASTASGKGVDLVARAMRVYDPMDYGAAGDGTANDYAAFAAADIAAAAAGLPLFVTETHRLNTSYTATADLVFLGGKVKPASGTTFTIATTIDAAPVQIFDVSLGGTITFSAPPPYGYAEWWGAVINDSGTDSYSALQKCLNGAGILNLRKGTYYSSQGLSLPDSSVVRGDGPLISAISIAHATDHLMSQAGVDSTSFATGADIEGFALARSVTPTTPASSADDRTQGHGLHLDLVSNVRVNRVYTYNNLIEVYVARTLASQIENVRGIRQTGTGTDRWAGLYVYGDPTGMPGGWATGPSGNPSCTIKKIQMAAMAGLASSTPFSLQAQLQDLWIEDPEAGGGHTQFDINPGSSTAGDFFLIRPIGDGYVTNGFNIRNMPLDASAIIRDAWVAPASGATSSGVLLSGAHGLDMNVKGNFTLASGLRCVDASDCSQLKIDADAVNCQYPLIAYMTNSSELKVRGFKNYSGADFGSVVTVTDSHTSTLDICTVATGTQKYLTAANIDNLSTGLTVNVTRTYAGSAADKITVNSVAVTTQGNVSGHVIINPGAGAML